MDPVKVITRLGIEDREFVDTDEGIQFYLYLLLREIKLILLCTGCWGAIEILGIIVL